MKFCLEEKANLSKPVSSLTCIFGSEFIVGDTTCQIDTVTRRQGVFSTLPILLAILS